MSNEQSEELTKLRGELATVKDLWQKTADHLDEVAEMHAKWRDMAGRLADVICKGDVAAQQAALVAFEELKNG